MNKDAKKNNPLYYLDFLNIKYSMILCVIYQTIEVKKYDPGTYKLQKQINRSNSC